MLALGARALDEHFQPLADQPPILLAVDPLLDRHDFTPAPLDRFRCHLVRHLKCRGPLFVRVLKTSHPLERCVLTNSFRSSKSSSVSPGSPTISEVRKVIPWTRARSFASNSVRKPDVRPRRIDNKSLSEAGWSGMSSDFPIFCSSAIAAIIG